MRTALGRDYPQRPFTGLIFLLMATTRDLIADGTLFEADPSGMSWDTKPDK